MEVTRRIDENGQEEPKSEYLRRVMEFGSNRAKILKLADRISNLISLGYVHNRDFVQRTLSETREHILPYAKAVNLDMDRELRDLIANREKQCRLIEPEQSALKS
jgi:(p)ppGpp synthase/HD superfamily hydrolase